MLQVQWRKIAVYNKWCVVITLVPLSLHIDANQLNTKTAVVFEASMGRTFGGSALGNNFLDITYTTNANYLHMTLPHAKKF